MLPCSDISTLAGADNSEVHPPVHGHGAAAANAADADADAAATATTNSTNFHPLASAVEQLSLDTDSVSPKLAGSTTTSAAGDSASSNGSASTNSHKEGSVILLTETDSVESDLKAPAPDKPSETKVPSHKAPAPDSNKPYKLSPSPTGTGKPTNKSAAEHDKERAAPLNPASALEGGREVSEKILYCGGLNKLASEPELTAIFNAVGPVLLLKVLHDKNRPSYNYAFIEFESNTDAAAALLSLQGVSISGSDIRLNWAYQLATNNSCTQGTLFNIFVGDLLPEVDDETLGKAFSSFPSLAQAHVMWDMQTSRLRGYGFVTFMQQQDAEQAIHTMNGHWINGRAIRCNWASHRQQQRFRGYPRPAAGPGRRDRPYGYGYGQGHANGNANANGHGQHHMPHHMPHHLLGYVGSYMPLADPGMHAHGQIDAFGGSGYDGAGPDPNTGPPALVPPALAPALAPLALAPPPPPANSIPIMSPQLYDIVLRQTPSWQTTVYLGNIAHFTVEQDLIPLLQNFGYIIDFKFQPERGCAFVRFDSHERAALAIVQLAGFSVNGRPLRCGWGKDRLPVPQFYSQVAAHLSLFVPGRP